MTLVVIIADLGSTIAARISARNLSVETASYGKGSTLGLTVISFGAMQVRGEAARCVVFNHTRDRDSTTRAEAGGNILACVLKITVLRIFVTAILATRDLIIRVAGIAVYTSTVVTGLARITAFVTAGGLIGVAGITVYAGTVVTGLARITAFVATSRLIGVAGITVYAGTVVARLARITAFVATSRLIGVAGTSVYASAVIAGLARVTTLIAACRLIRFARTVVYTSAIVADLSTAAARVTTRNLVFFAVLVSAVSITSSPCAYAQDSYDQKQRKIPSVSHQFHG